MQSADGETAVSTPKRSSRRILRPRFLVGSVLSAAIIAAVAYGVVFYVVDDESSAAASELLEAPVTVGDLVDSVSSDGTIVFPERSVMSFGTGGTIEELLVEVGDEVSEGQVLARLDDLTVSNLATNVEEARAALEKAEDDLAEAVSAASALELAEAELAIVSAQRAVDDATDSLATLQEPEASDLLRAQAAVTTAESKLVNAQEALSDLEALPDAQTVSEAQVALTFAIDTYNNALADQLVTVREWEVSIDAATTALSDASAGYNAEFEQWLGYTLDDAETGESPSTILANAGIDLNAIFSSASEDFRFTASSDDPTTPWNELTIFWWTFLSPEKVVATGESGTGINGTKSVEDELNKAWDAVVASADAMADVDSRHSVARTQGEKSVSSAQSAVTASEEKLADVNQPATALDIQVARDSISVASSDLDDARADLVLLTNPEASDIDAAKATLATTEARLADKHSDLVDLQAIGSDTQLINLRTVEVDASSAVLANAISLLDDAVLKSPVDGIVDAVNFEAGNEVQRNSVVVEIIDPTVVTVEMDVDQVDILAVAVGAEAAVTLDALVGQTLTGVVTDIGVASNGGTGTVTFPVTVTVQVPAGTDLLEGLTATAEMVTSFRPDLLLVPSVAVGGSFTQPSVDVLRNGTVETVFVTLDGGNETYAVIGSGVVEGDTVLFKLPGVSEETNPFAVLRAGSGFGSFGSGGGAGRPPGGSFNRGSNGPGGR
ncbi:MAG: efflux RND transporter periplasmic adaptor subunit [Chloroflexi bacterium]|nr:efflux RND transporter periplasmic adaptor subunit [Chloroflexota bacterium]